MQWVHLPWKLVLESSIWQLLQQLDHCHGDGNSEDLLVLRVLGLGQFVDLVALHLHMHTVTVMKTMGS